MRKILAIIFLSFLLINSINTSADTENKISKRIQEPTSFESIPIDISIDKLTQQYNGVDPIALYKELNDNKNKFLQDVYESTEAFNSRLKVLENNVIGRRYLHGDFKYVDSVAFIIPDPDYTYPVIYQKYNADDNTLMLSWGLRRIGAGDGLHYIDLVKNELGKSQYIGHNAFGVKILITQENFESYSIAIKSYRYLIDRSMKIVMTLDKAKEIREKGRFLVVGNLVRPYILEETDYSSATIDYPREIIDRKHLIILDNVDVWLFNYQTGYIYEKTLSTFK